jgi:hypothetical protein
MSPQVLVGVDPQVSFANHCEDGGLRDGVGAEVLQLHPVVMQNRLHEAACRPRAGGGGNPLRLPLIRERAK